MSSEMVLWTENELMEMEGLDLMPEGMEDLDQGDFGLPPRLRISQPNRPIEVNGEEIAPGLIVNTMTGDSWDMVQIVPLVFMPNTRVMWPETFNTDSKPECASDDGKMPNMSRVDLTNMQDGPCRTCPMAEFVNGQKPRCSNQRNILVWIVNTNEPAILTMQSTALKEARQLTSLVKMTGIKRSIQMTTYKIKDPKGTWVIPQFSRGEPLPFDQIKALVEVKKELANLVITADTGEAPPPSDNGFTSGHVIETDDIPF